MFIVIVSLIFAIAKMLSWLELRNSWFLLHWQNQIQLS